MELTNYEGNDLLLVDAFFQGHTAIKAATVKELALTV